MDFSRQGYWSELPFPSPEDLPNLGTETRSLALQADSLLLSHQGPNPQMWPLLPFRFSGGNFISLNKHCFDANFFIYHLHTSYIIYWLLPWMTSLTQWTWVWASSGSWWWTGKCGVLQSMGSQRVRHDWTTMTSEDLAYLQHLTFFSPSQTLIVILLFWSSISYLCNFVRYNLDLFLVPSFCHSISWPLSL